MNRTLGFVASAAAAPWPVGGAIAVLRCSDARRIAARSELGGVPETQAAGSSDVTSPSISPSDWAKAVVAAPCCVGAPEGADPVLPFVRFARTSRAVMGSSAVPAGAVYRAVHCGCVDESFAPEGAATITPSGMAIKGRGRNVPDPRCGRH